MLYVGKPKVLDVAQVHHVLDTVVHSAALSLNFLLLYLILHRSGDHMSKAYKNVLLVTCAFDIALATIMWVSQPVSKGTANVLRCSLCHFRLTHGLVGGFVQRRMDDCVHQRVLCENQCVL